MIPKDPVAARKELELELLRRGTVWPYELRGANRELMLSNDPQVINAGPADTGKSVACCLKLHRLCRLYPKSQHVIARKTQTSLYGSILQTYARIAGNEVSTYGGEKPSWYDYPNGSRVWVCGMDNPEKALSSERDSIYVNQAEELTLTDWEILSTRCNGRNAVVPFAQLFGDCNPGGSKHWIKEAARVGSLRLLYARHQDNPTIYNADGTPTAGGQRRLDALSRLTGLRRKRLFEGIWATAEGAVYDTFDASLHVKVRPRSEMKRHFLAIDEGYTNPAVILDIGEDADGRWHVFREFYQTGVLPAQFVKTAKEWFAENRCEMAAVDESAAGLIADMISEGVNARGGKGRVIDGITRIQNRLQIQGDGLPRYTVDPSCVNHINEFESYVWQPDKPKDTPKKEDDHSLDAARYLGDALGEPTGAFGNQSLEELTRLMRELNPPIEDEQPLEVTL